MKILITDEVHPSLIQIFTNRGWTCDYLPDISQQDCELRLQAYQGLIINTKIRVTEVMMRNSLGLKCIGRLGSGLDRIDLEAAKRLNVKVFSSPEGNANAVAEHAFALILAWMNRLPRANQDVRLHRWQREANRGIELNGATIGVIGFGHTGQAFCRKWAGWDVRLLVYDKYVDVPESDFLFPVKYQTLLHESDIISLHIPLTKETYHMVNTEMLHQCKSNLLLINTSRGGVIHTQNLIEFMHLHPNSGACLDVFEEEPPFELPEWEDLKTCENILFTPHIAGWSRQSKELVSSILAEKMARDPTLIQ